MAITMLILMAIIILIISSCTTTRDVVETITVHDTVTAIRTDTVENVKVLEIHDTTKVKEYHTFTINNNGDTIRENHHLIEIQKTIVVDSTHYYQSERDSLRQALIEEQQKTKVITKEKVPIKWMLITCAAVIITFLLIIRELKKKVAEMRNRT